MIRAAMRGGLAAGFFCLFTAFGAFGQEAPVPSPEESLGRARTLMSEGRSPEALELLRLTQELFPEWPRAWELRVLQEACRQALGLKSLSAEGADDRRERLRIAQVLLFEGKTIEDIEANLVRLRDAGVNTVFIRVFHNFGDRPLLKGGPSARSGVYFQTDAAPVLEDYLSAIIPVCRRLGLSIFAWMTTRRCEWLLAEAYDIDGILFQDDLVMRTGEGLSPEAVGAYMEDGGVAVSPETLFRMDGPGPFLPLFSPDMYRPAFWDWVSWKNRRLLELAWELMDTARRVRPELRFALNLYYEAVLNPRMALAWYAQDLSAARGYPFDYFSLMSYHRQIGKELSLSGAEALDVLTSMSRRAVSEVGRPERVIMKIQSLDWDTHQLLPGDELDRALSAASPMEGVSLAFVRSSSDPPLDVIRKHFLPREE
jgi:biofilm PGA synthesis lipoprotein PgaB